MIFGHCKDIQMDTTLETNKHSHSHVLTTHHTMQGCLRHHFTNNGGFITEEGPLCTRTLTMEIGQRQHIRWTAVLLHTVAVLPALSSAHHLLLNDEQHKQKKHSVVEDISRLCYDGKQHNRSKVNKRGGHPLHSLSQYQQWLHYSGWKRN